MLLLRGAVGVRSVRLRNKGDFSASAAKTFIFALDSVDVTCRFEGDVATVSLACPRTLLRGFLVLPRLSSCYPNGPSTPAGGSFGSAASLCAASL